MEGDKVQTLLKQFLKALPIKDAINNFDWQQNNVWNNMYSSIRKMSIILISKTIVIISFF